MEQSLHHEGTFLIHLFTDVWRIPQFPLFPEMKATREPDNVISPSMSGYLAKAICSTNTLIAYLDMGKVVINTRQKFKKKKTALSGLSKCT